MSTQNNEVQDVSSDTDESHSDTQESNNEEPVLEAPVVIIEPNNQEIVQEEVQEVHIEDINEQEIVQRKNE